MPAVGLVALADVLGEGERRVALDRDVVVVVEDDQAAEAEVAGQRARLGGDPLLEVAVGDDHVGEVADHLLVEAGGEHALAERHADRGRDALSERPGGGLDPRRVAVLGVAGGRRAELAEVLEVVERDPVPGQVQDRVQEHRRVAGRQHEAVARGPVRVLRRMAHHARVEQVGHGRQRHRRARVARVGLLDRVHRERADGVDAQLVERGLRRLCQVGSLSWSVDAHTLRDSDGLRGSAVRLRGLTPYVGATCRCAAPVSAVAWLSCTRSTHASSPPSSSRSASTTPLAPAASAVFAVGLHPRRAPWISLLPDPWPASPQRRRPVSALPADTTSIMEVVLRRVSCPAFVGRSDELAALDSALARASEGIPAFAFVAGESGVGKSRLVAEFEAHAEGGGRAGARRALPRARRHHLPVRAAGGGAAAARRVAARRDEPAARVRGAARAARPPRPARARDRGPALGRPLDARLPHLPRPQRAHRVAVPARHLPLRRAAPPPPAPARAGRARARPRRRADRARALHPRRGRRAARRHPRRRARRRAGRPPLRAQPRQRALHGGAARRLRRRPGRAAGHAARRAARPLRAAAGRRAGGPPRGLGRRAADEPRAARDGRRPTK